MKIGLKGIVKYRDGGHKYVDVLVSVDGSEILETHTVGVDIEVNHDTIRQFLVENYDIDPDQIIWPEHIKQKDF